LIFRHSTGLDEDGVDAGTSLFERLLEKKVEFGNNKNKLRIKGFEYSERIAAGDVILCNLSGKSESQICFARYDFYGMVQRRDCCVERTYWNQKMIPVLDACI
jgi:hypothetical protein